MKQPQYNKGDKVMFLFDGFNYALPGIIETVDASGTFFQKEQPYYDVISPIQDNCLYKHVPEENIKSAEEIAKDDNRAKLIRSDDERNLYTKLGSMFGQIYYDIHAVYEPDRWNIFGDCYMAGVDLFKCGMTFRVYFKEKADGSLSIENVERWRFG